MILNTSLERWTGFGPATFSLEGRHSTTELPPRHSVSGREESHLPPLGPKPSVLLMNYSPIMGQNLWFFTALPAGRQGFSKVVSCEIFIPSASQDNLYSLLKIYLVLQTFLLVSHGANLWFFPTISL